MAGNGTDQDGAGQNEGDQNDGGLGLEGEDRLPWLEAADDYDEDGEVSPVRLLVMVLGGLLLIGAVLGGRWKLMSVTADHAEFQNLKFPDIRHNLRAEDRSGNASSRPTNDF